MSVRRSRNGAEPTSTAATPVVAVLTAVFATLLAAACSLPVNGEIDTLDTDEYADVVSGLDTTTTTEPLPDEGTTIRLFYYDELGQLHRVFRPFAAEPGIPEILIALQEGPSDGEKAENPTLRTELPAGLNPEPVRREEGQETIIVNVSDEGGLRQLVNDVPLKAEFVLTQLVCTLTNLNLLSGIPITGVEFHDSGGRIPIVDANREPINGAARASNFNDCMTQAELDALAEGEEGEDGEVDGSTSTTEG